MNVESFVGHHHLRIAALGSSTVSGVYAAVRLRISVETVLVIPLYTVFTGVAGDGLAAHAYGVTDTLPGDVTSHFGDTVDNLVADNLGVADRPPVSPDSVNI